MRPHLLKSWPILLGLTLLIPFAGATTIETLRTKELITLCKDFNPEQLTDDNRECKRYIKGIVDGLILSTKFSSELNNSSGPAQSDFESRLVNTRIMSRVDRTYRPSEHQICIDDSSQLTSVVNTLADSVVDQAEHHKYARYVVYNSLLAHFKCTQ